MDATNRPPVWRKSRHCDSGGCVEVALSAERVGMRDSEDQDGPALWFTAGSWRAFLDGVRRDEFDAG